MIDHEYELKNENIIKQENSNDFMGIKINQGQPYIFVPQTFRISDDIIERNKNVLFFLRSISLAFTKNNENIQTSSFNGNNWPIDSYIWIIYDFINNGFYYNRNTILSNDANGKINWKRTLKKTPIYSKGKIVYIDIVSNKESPVSDDISEIYEYCVVISSIRIGWLYNFRLRIPYKQKKTVSEMKYFIKRELSSTFDDIKRRRFFHILKILSNIDDDTINSTYHTYGILNYHYVYEKMVNKYFKGISDVELSKYYPHGEWHLLPNLNDIFFSKELQLDTIYHRKDSEGNKYTYIIDAKMYKYGGLKWIHNLNYGLPETSSIHKQITYGEYVQNYVDYNSNVRNIFILPFNKELERFKNISPFVEYLDENRNFAFIGYCTGEWKRNRNKKNHNDFKAYEYIFTFLIDFNHLLMNYQHNKDNELILNKTEELLNLVMRI